MKYSLLMRPAFYMFLITVLFINACDNGNNGDEPDELQKGEGLIPAVIGNRWIYADSLWLNDSLWHANFDTVEIIDTVMRGDQIWWQTKGYIPDLWDQYPINGEFYIRNDSIYGVTYPWGNRLTALRFIPPTNTSISYSIPYSDFSIRRTAVIHPEPITVPAGAFDSCGVYLDYFGIEIVIAPGIGVISESKFSALESRKRILIEYELVLD